MIEIKKSFTLLPIILLLLFSCSAFSAVIKYESSQISASTWSYTYDVYNASASYTIEEFTIFFDLGLYSNIAVSSTPSIWDPLVVQPDPAIPNDGFYDALTLGAGISPGSNVSGFTVLFDFLGTGAPGSQYFEIVDPVNFSVLGSGQTQLAVVTQPPVSVPEPETWKLLLVVMMFFGLVWFLKKSRDRDNIEFLSA